MIKKRLVNLCKKLGCKAYKRRVANIGMFVVALGVGLTMSYFNQAHAGVIADLFQEPVDDFISLITSDLGNTVAVFGIIAALFMAIWQQSIMWGISMVVGTFIIWSGIELIGA